MAVSDVSTRIAATESMIARKEFTSSDIWKQIKHLKTSGHLQIVERYISTNGDNLLEFCTTKGRASILKLFLYCGSWKVLYNKNKLSSVRSVKCQQELEELDTIENSLTDLMRTARTGDLDLFKRTLQQTSVTEYHYQSSNSGTVLYWAVVGGSVEVFQETLKLGIDPTVPAGSSKKESLLHCAAQLGHSEMIVPILNSWKVSKKDFTEDINRAAEVAAENGDVEFIKVLQKVFIKVLQNTNVVLPQTILPTAAASGRKLCVEFCITELHININSGDKYTRTALMRAVESQHMDIFSFLLNQPGHNWMHITTTGRNIIHSLAESGQVQAFDQLVEVIPDDILKILINQRDRYAGVELCFLIRGKDHGRSAYHYIEVARYKVPVFLKKTKSGHVDVANYGTVIKSGWGENPDAETIGEIEKIFHDRRLDTHSPLDCTPLHLAAFKGHTEMCQKLIAAGADVNLPERYNCTPAMLVAAKGDLELLRILEKAGGILNGENSDHKTILDIAVENEQPQIEQFLGTRDYREWCKEFRNHDVPKLLEKLDNVSLDRIRAEGGDVKRHIIDTLRHFTSDINRLLVQLGSGPVMNATD